MIVQSFKLYSNQAASILLVLSALLLLSTLDLGSLFSLHLFCLEVVLKLILRQAKVMEPQNFFEFLLFHWLVVDSNHAHFHAPIKCKLVRVRSQSNDFNSLLPR